MIMIDLILCIVDIVAWDKKLLKKNCASNLVMLVKQSIIPPTKNCIYFFDNFLQERTGVST